MGKIVYVYIISLSVTFSACSQAKNQTDSDSKQVTADVSANQEDCNWCGASEAPENVDWKTVIPEENEPGEKLLISGIIYLPDGVTPAKDIIVYVYHTNKEGIYPKRGDERGNGQYHGYLRGWMKTDINGKYEFETIRPAPYHSHGGEPAHIHYTIQGPDYPEYWLTALWFADDSRVTDEYLESVKRSGGFSNVTTLTRDENKTLIGSRNIILQKFED